MFNYILAQFKFIRIRLIYRLVILFILDSIYT